MRVVSADALMMKEIAPNVYLVDEEVIRNAPTFDAEPVVRCKECKCWDLEHISSEGYARCLTGESGVRYRKENDFCSRGERKGK